MPYRVYLIDSTSFIELDTENVDLRTVFSVADVTDVGLRKDNGIKNVIFKGTKNNNYAFGSLFHLNKVADLTLPTRLFFNYNPLRTVQCVVYEDAMLVFKGSLRVNEVNIKDSGDVLYQTTITGNFIEFKNIIQDKLLTDLDFTDLKHRYHSDVIFNSWDTSIETTNSFGAQQTVAFEKGKGYIYPFIDYGYLFRDTTLGINQDSNRIKVDNFKPAIYVNEYLKRIFVQPGLEGFSYEVKGNSEFLERFNSLVIPNADESLSYKFSGFYEKFFKSPATTVNQTGSNFLLRASAKLITINSFTPPPANTINPFIIYYGTSVNTLYVDRSVTADASVVVQFSSIYAEESGDFYVQLVERNESTNGNALQEWEMIGETKIHLVDGQTVSNQIFNLVVGERKYIERKQLAIRVYMKYDSVHIFAPDLNWAVTSAELKFPKDDLTTFTADIKINSGSSSDIISPKAPENVKQVDFLKGIINLLNMYVYTDSENPMKLIFQKYDDYYAFASPQNIKTTSLNWTSRVDYNSGVKITSNLSIPKSYQFTFKDDTDFINIDYKKKYGEPYGTFKFNDAFGITDTKKVELIFSATPITQYSSSNRLHPALYTIESNNKVAAKTNIRILYYNGVKSCVEYVISKDKYTSAWTTEDIATKTQYPQVSNYWYNSSNLPIEDLHFGRPKELYFNITPQYVNASTSYTNYYSGQITELTNSNLFIVECSVLLNEIDINNLDLKVPVYIDMNELGHSYFKILSVEYLNNYTPAVVKLQKVVLGSER